MREGEIQKEIWVEKSKKYQKERKKEESCENIKIIKEKIYKK